MARTIETFFLLLIQHLNSNVLGLPMDKDGMKNIAKFKDYSWRIGSHLNCLLLNDGGVFKYEYHMDPKLEKFYGPLINKARESSDWRIAKNARYTMKW